MKRLANYIPEIMLAVGVLLAAGILLTCKCPRPAAPKYHGPAPIVGLGHLGQPEPECVNGKMPAGATACWVGGWKFEFLPARPDAELYGKWMQVRPLVESCDGQNLMVHCW